MATFLLERPPSSKATARFLDFLRELGPDAIPAYEERFFSYVRPWREARRGAESRDDKAWFALQAGLMKYEMRVGRG